MASFIEIHVDNYTRYCKFRQAGQVPEQPAPWMPALFRLGITPKQLKAKPDLVEEAMQWGTDIDPSLYRLPVDPGKLPK